MNNLSKEIKTLVAKVIKVPEDKIDPNANLFTQLGVDSLLGVEIFAALDKKYVIDVPEDRLRGIGTLNDIIRLVEGVHPPSPPPLKKRGGEEKLIRAGGDIRILAQAFGDRCSAGAGFPKTIQDFPSLFPPPVLRHSFDPSAFLLSRKSLRA